MWRSNQLSYRTLSGRQGLQAPGLAYSCPASSFPRISYIKQIWQYKKIGRTKNIRISLHLRLISPTGASSSRHGLRHALRKVAISRKEVFQPHLPVRLPCYDLAPITSFALGRSLRARTAGTPGFHGLTGGVYKARERIHRAMADARLLANPASWGRVADPSPN